MLESYYVRHAVRTYNIGAGYKRIYFYHVQKAGGSSIKRIFYELTGLEGDRVHRMVLQSRDARVKIDDKIFVGWNKKLINEGYYFFASTHIPLAELSLPPNTFTFTCLRDPMTRILSRYKELVNYQRSDPSHVHLQTVKDWFNADFSVFLTNMPKREYLRQLQMFSASYNVDEAVDQIANCEYFFILEDFDQGILALADQLQIPLKPKHVRQSGIQFSPESADIERLQEMIAPEKTLYERIRKIYCSRKDRLKVSVNTSDKSR